MQLPTFQLGKKGNPFQDERLYDYRYYPEDLYAKPGERAANRALWQSGARGRTPSAPRNTVARCLWSASADLAGSTNISGFADAYGDFKGYGWYERTGTAEGSPAASRDHRVRQLGDHGRYGDGKLRRRPRKGI